MSLEAPKRIQRKRSKGWKMPENTVYVGRPTIWGNPFKTAAEYRAWLNGKQGIVDLGVKPDLLKSIGQLRGKNLACWCPLNKPCHADVLLELANRMEELTK